MLGAVGEAGAGVPVVSPAEAREWVPGTLHGSRVRLAESLRAEGRGWFYLVKPSRHRISGWFRPDWLEDAQARVYATRATARDAAEHASSKMAMEWLRRGWPIHELGDPGAEVVRVQRLPWWVREVEMADGEIVRLERDTFAAGCGCLVWVSLIGSVLVATITAWLSNLITAAIAAAAVLAGVAVLIAGRWFMERSDAEARAICLCGLSDGRDEAAARR